MRFSTFSSCAALSLLLGAWPAGAAPQNWEQADAKIAAATTSPDKINALSEKAGLVLTARNPSREELNRAADALDEALKIIRQGSEKFTGLGPFYFRCGRVSEMLERYEAARQFYDEAEKAGYLDDNARNPSKGSELLANRATCKSALYDFAGALADLNRAIALRESALWVKKRAFTHFESGDWESAVADWKRVIALDPLQKLEAPTNSLDDPIAAPAPELVLPFDRALLTWNAAIAADPRDAAPFAQRARYRVKKALPALEANPGFSPQPDYGSNADRPTLTQTLEEAIRDWTRLTQLDPKNAEAWRERGKTRGYLWIATRGDSSYDEQQPVVDFNRALNLDATSALSRLEAGLYLAHRFAPPRHTLARAADGRKKDVQSAQMNFSRAIFMAPNASADAHYQRALIERQSEKPDAHTLWEDYSAIIGSDLKALSAPASAVQRAEVLAESHLMRGKILLGRGQRGAALQELDASLRASESQPARLERGKLRVIRGEYDGALEDLQRVGSAESLLWRAGAHEGKGETAKAVAAVAAALERAPELKDRVRGTRYDAANPTQIGLAPKPETNDVPLVLTGTALERKNRGNELISKGDLAGGLAEYNAAIALDPKFADAYNNRGARYLAQQKYDLALADFNRAIELDPKHRVAYANRADLWEQLNQSAQRRADLDRALEYADTPARRVTVLADRARTRLDAQDSAGALADIELARAQAGQDADSWSAIAGAQWMAEKYQDAAQSFARAIELQPSRSREVLSRALALVLAGAPDAESELQKALALANSNDLEYAKSFVSALSRRRDSAPLRALQQRLNQPR